MNKMILALASVLMISTSAFANTGIDVVDADAVIEHEAGAMDPMTVDSNEVTFFHSNTGEAIIGGIIGGVIGAIAADRWDRDDRNYRPGRPGRGGYRWATCFAQNRRGETFRASARNARRAQNEAMRKCYDYSRACRPVGCR